MPDRRQFLFNAMATLVPLSGCDDTKRPHMKEIKIDLGKDIVETARGSGAPEFQAQKVNNTIIYSLVPVPPQRPVRFTRSGFEITWEPAFGLKLYGSALRGSIAESASISLNSSITSHPEAQAFVEQTIAQFAKGKWKRFRDPVWDVMLTGRSSYLNEVGEIDAQATGAADPAYKLSVAEWPIVANQGVRWYWIGDGVLATLHVHNMVGADEKFDYRMNLDFELIDTYKATLDRNEKDSLSAGDAKGWNSTAKNEASKKTKAALNERLIANAIKRGDRVVQD
jgi:hypothetical protein